MRGLADDGGLFVPERIPALSIDLDELPSLSYRETAFRVMRDYLMDFTEEELRTAIAAAYDEKFDDERIAPLVRPDSKGPAYLELFHGKTIAFKDMALSILPHFMTIAARKRGLDSKILILTATSGDTGKAALSGFADVPGTEIIVFFPKDGVSEVQRLQMVTEKGKNTHVVSVNGNFDDCQSGVKKIFSDPALRAEMEGCGYQFSSANSINIGRLVPQIVYYVYAYGQMCKLNCIKPGEKINFVVPTGNFGNILAGYYARSMGLPVNKLICASNENKVLFDFLNTGVYDRNRKFLLTHSPSMDILISSNLERLIYKIEDEDPIKTASLMKELSEKGRYQVTSEILERAEGIRGYFASETECFGKIKSLYKETDYIIDTHTAVAAAALDKYLSETKDDTPTVIVSTASPYKFADSVVSAIDPSKHFEGSEGYIDALRSLGAPEIPDAIKEIREAKIVHGENCDPSEMGITVKKVLGIIAN